VRAHLALFVPDLALEKEVQPGPDGGNGGEPADIVP
jgi:hypothetical protein